MGRLGVLGCRPFPVVCCSSSYDAESLRKKTNKELMQILKDSKISGYSGKPKEQLIQLIQENLVAEKKDEAPKQLEEKKQKKKVESKPYVEDIESLKFTDYSDLETKLLQFTVAELSKALKARGASPGRLKMEIVRHLASLIEEEHMRSKALIEDPETEAASLQQAVVVSTDTNMEKALSILKEHGIDRKINPEMFIDIRHFAKCVEMETETRRGENVVEDKNALMNILRKSVEAVGAENLKTMHLRERCKSFDIKITEEDSRAVLLDHLLYAEEELMTWYDMETEKAKTRMVDLLSKWLKEIEDSIIEDSSYKDLDNWSEDELLSKLKELEFEITSHRQVNENLIRNQLLSELNLTKTALAILALRLVYKCQTIKTTDLVRVFDLSVEKKEKLKSSEIVLHMFQSLFLESCIASFFQLYDMKLDQEKQLKDEIIAYFQDEAIMLASARKKEDRDPLLTFGVVFGGGQLQLEEQISSVRNLLDNLQTGPHLPPNGSKIQELDKDSKGFQVFLYFLGSNPKEIVRLSTAEFLSMDVLAFENWPFSHHQRGERISSFGALIDELEDHDYVLPLTPALDWFASQNKKHHEQLEGLDSLCFGSSMVVRNLTHNQFMCLVYLKSCGFMTPAIYRIQKTDIADLENWTKSFRRFCNYLQMEDKDLEFEISAYSPVEKHRSETAKGLTGIVDLAKSLFSAETLEEAIIQPVLDPDRYFEFSCVVLETKTGPVALVPTEYEYLPAKYVRSLSTGLRRHTPPRHTMDIIEAIRKTSVAVFEKLKLAGCACVNGRVMIDIPKTQEENEKDLPLPRPIPADPKPYEETELSEKFQAHLESLLEEKDEKLRQEVKANEEVEYTDEGLEYLKALDAMDAENGIQINRYEEIEQHIQDIKEYLEKADKEDNEARKQGSTKFVKLERLKRTLLAEKEAKERVEAKEKIKNFEVVITGVEASLSFAPNSLLFHQAAVSGLSHEAVFRHLVAIGLPDSMQLPPIKNDAILSNPFFPENYPPKEEEEEERDLMQKKTPQIWILCGGDGTAHQASLVSALNVYLKLKTASEVQVYVFVLDPGRRRSASVEVLKALYKRREDLLTTGVPEVNLPPECRLAYLKCPKTAEYEVPWHPVWCLQPSQYLSSTVDEAIEAADRFIKIDCLAMSARKDYMNAFTGIQLSCQQELHDAGVEGVGSLWGGNFQELQPPPRMMTMDMFAEEAGMLGAVVFLTVAGEVVQSGSLQDYLESQNVRYTGPGLSATRLCGAKDQLAPYLGDLGEIRSLEQYPLPSEYLVDCGKDMENAEDIFVETTGYLQSIEMCLKPIQDSLGGGIVRVSSVADLYTYGLALLKNFEVLDGALFPQPHCTVPMCKPLAKTYVFEKYIRPASVLRNIHGDITLSKTSNLVEVSFGLFGDIGQMYVLNPSLVITNLETEESLERRYLKGLKTCLTPIPPEIASEEIILVAKKSVERVADVLGLRGLSRVDAFMDIKNGNLMIIEVEVCPLLNEHSIIFQQAALEDPPIYPDQILEQVIQLGLQVVPETEEEEESMTMTDPGIEEDISRPWEDSKFWETEEEADDEKAIDSSNEGQESLSNLWGSDSDEDEITVPNSN